MLPQITPHAFSNLGAWKTFITFAVFNFALIVYAFFSVREVGDSLVMTWGESLLTSRRHRAHRWRKWKTYLPLQS